MKKMYFIGLFVLALLLVSGVVIAKGESERYVIKSNDIFLKAQLGIIHNFDNAFTSDLTQGQVKALQKIGVEVEMVELYQISGKPECGDGICQGNEARTCLVDCLSNPDPEPERTCTPNVQIPYGITMVNGGSGGVDVNVAVLDTGVAINHPDLDIKLCKDTTKRGIKNGCRDGNGHGTHVSGIIAANGGVDGFGVFGVAPETNLWSIKVCGNAGCWADDIAEAIRYATNQGVNIISMSLGGNAESKLIKDTIDYAVSEDVLFIAAAGNDGPSEGSIDYPGANVKIIAVGAIDSNKNVPSWSSRGVNDGDYIIEAREVEFGAPGVSVESTWNNGCYNVISGTSMSTPHIAGLAAKLWQGDASSTRIYLQELAKNYDLYVTGDDSATGFGMPIAP